MQPYWVITVRPLRLWFALTAVIAAAPVGCSSSEAEPCTSDVWPSVLIWVVDATGASVHDAKVTYTLNGGPLQVAGCYRRVDSGCGRWRAGTEEMGTFTIVAKSADGSKTARSDVVVTGGACGGHVKTVETTLTLQ